MTATPIPRTIALTLYGELDLSVIKELPRGRKQIKTWVVPDIKRDAAYQWITKLLKETSQQAFVVCPFVEPSESLTSVKSATAEYERLSREVFPMFRLALLHGRMKPTEKMSILTEFRERKIDILVCTPVVEVGIDIPTATVMLIEAAERFGLAQLHQLRGRIGRGKWASYCLLFTSNEQKETARLKLMEKATSGPELAELDLKMRGPGSLFGLAQHGRDKLRVATYADATLIEEARVTTQEILEADPDLRLSPLLKQRVLSGTIWQIAPD
jgi:ATP-dependent DNA helicase RecG